MNSESFGRLIAGFFFLSACFCPVVQAQQSVAEASVASTNSAQQTSAEQIAALELERTNVWKRVIQIVNQPVQAYAQRPDISVSVYSPGWFHEGAIKPEFNTVDVRKSQELIYANQPYVSSDLNHGIVFLGRDLEFNAMTKFFYVDRSLPKHRLTEAEMLEINRLYRIIGRCESEINRLQAPATESPSLGETEDQAESDAEPGQWFAAIRRIPTQTRVLYGGIAIGALVLLAMTLRWVRKGSD